MRVLTNSWHCWLVATVLWTMLAGAPAPAAADDQSPKPPAATADREKVEQQLRAIKQKVEQLEKDGKHDEAEKLKQEARALYSKINPRANAIPAPGGAEREQLYQQMRAIHEKMEKAAKEGNQDEVQRLKKEADALRGKLYEQRGYGSSRPQSSGDREARLQHLRSAAENLKAAGCEPEAQHVMQIIQRMQAEGSGEGRPRAGATASAGTLTLIGTTSYDATSSAVQELRSQVEQMHREMRELREQVNRSKSSEQK